MRPAVPELDPPRRRRRVTSPALVAPPPAPPLSDGDRDEQLRLAVEQALGSPADAEGGNSTVDVICLTVESRTVIEEISPAPIDLGAGSASPVCPPCGSPIDPLRARHLSVVDGRVVPFCSPQCKDKGADAAPPPLEDDERAESRVAPRGRWPWLAVVLPVLAGAGVLLGLRVSFDGRTATAGLPVNMAQQVARAAPAPVEPEPEPTFGPELPPPDFFIESERWVHPLAGPVRRLPERPTRRFGAGRDHDSPDSCGGGHCGVDIGEVKGEAVLAVHDGTIERIVRVEGGDRGGKYVRLLHYGGRIVTQYMHLDEVAPELKPGMHVRAGEKLGTVGDSGTKNSGPHLHFTFATRANEGSPEAYVDPLALLTVWPLAPL